MLKVIPNKGILFSSERVGAMHGLGPESGYYFDETKGYRDAIAISAAEKANLFEHNIRRVRPQLNRHC